MALPSEEAHNWSQFETRLRSFVGRRVDAQAADDVVGDILLRLTEHGEAWSAADNPTAWMYRVASNAIANFSPPTR